MCRVAFLSPHPGMIRPHTHLGTAGRKSCPQNSPFSILKLVLQLQPVASPVVSLYHSEFVLVNSQLHGSAAGKCLETANGVECSYQTFVH